MPRLFEMRRTEVNEDVTIVVDLDKVCAVVVEKPTGHHYETIKVRFVDGNEVTNLVPPEQAAQFLDAYRAYLGAQE